MEAMYTEPSTEKSEIVHMPPPPKPRRGPAARPPVEIKVEENIQKEISVNEAAESAEREVGSCGNAEDDGDGRRTEKGACHQ